MGANLLFLNEYDELESVDPASYAEALGVSAPVASGAGMVSIVTLLSIYFSLFSWFLAVLVKQGSNL